jgi:PAS domain S-box-containing protein
MGKTTSDPPFFARPDGDPDDLAAALTESQGLLALAEQSAGIGIWDTDLATDMVRATPTFFRLMGLPVSAEPIANDVVRAVRHPDDAARVRDGFRDALARGVDCYEVEYRIIRPSDGELRWIFGRGRAVRDGGGQPVRYSGVDMDVTERKRAEEHVRLLMNELNHRANNLLTVVQALAHQTADSADAKAFARRLRPTRSSTAHWPATARSASSGRSRRGPGRPSSAWPGWRRAARPSPSRGARASAER